MKLAHVADSHWGLNYPGPHPAARFEDITRTMDWVADRILEEGCGIVLFCGDAFKDARIYIDRATLEISAFVAWLRKITSGGAECVVISGTPSHDAVSAYRLIDEMKIPGVTVFTSPGIHRARGLNIACLPGMNRSSFATDEAYQGLAPHVFHQKMSDWITEECNRLRKEFSDQHPAILMSHLTYDLADTGFEDALLLNEPILTDEAASLFDLVTLGHIHRSQQAGRNVFYSGAPERHNFGDERTVAGFWIHEIFPPQEVDDNWPFQASARSTFIETPARRFKTIQWSGLEIEAWLSGQLEIEDVESTVVRVHYTCSEDLQKRFDRRSLERALYDAGAFYVHEIKADVERTERARDAEVTDDLSPLSALAHWGRNQGISEDEIASLQSLTAGLLEEVPV